MNGVSDFHDMDGKSNDERVALAHRIGKFLVGDVGGKERTAAEELVRVLANDTSVIVREALSQELKACQFIPKDVAMRMARDVEQVSMPFLIETNALSLETLIEIAKKCGEVARMALAQRDGVPEELSFAISEHGEETSISLLLANETAELSTRVCLALTERFGDNTKVMEGMSERHDLPLDVVDDLVKRMSADIAGSLMERYGMAKDYGDYLASTTQFRAMKDRMSQANDAELERYLRGLHRDNLMNPSFILQLARAGRARPTKIALAIRTGLPIGNISVLLKGDSVHAFEGLAEKAGFSPAFGRPLKDAYDQAVAEGLWGE